VVSIDKPPIFLYILSVLQKWFDGLKLKTTNINKKGKNKI